MTLPSDVPSTNFLALTDKMDDVPESVKTLLTSHLTFHPHSDVESIIKAYKLAEELHRGQNRRSGEPYIVHPIEVTRILADLGMDATTLIAGLLHDTVEDTEMSVSDINKRFGAEVAHLVEGVTKIDKVAMGASAESETLRKMITAMAKDPRVLVIKIADRLHNMRTMRFLPPEKQERKANETLDVIAPLAHRLGLSTLKWELEDLSFSVLHPKKYQEIVRLVAKRAPKRDVYLSMLNQEINTALEISHITATVQTRPKHYWSIYQKMIVKGREFDDIHDLVGVRIICQSIRDCYAAIGVVHSLWQPLAQRFKDYVAHPRFGVYQSLHTTVIGPEGKAVEVQIRTEEMHQTAEYGIAAHWRYKETRGTNNQYVPEIDDMAWMRQLLDWQKDAADPDEFLDSLRYNLASKEIFTFTPKGDVITLPVGATPVDFAYSVHTEVGHRCLGARVNGRLVALETHLEHGNVVEIFTSKTSDSSPSRDWLDFVSSPRAKTKIRQWFAKERREEALEKGKSAILKEIKKFGLPLQRLMTSDTMLAISTDLNYQDVSALYIAVGEHQISAQKVLSHIVNFLGGIDEAEEEILERSISTKSITRTNETSSDCGVLVSGLTGIKVKLAKCCTPVPGDTIMGFVTRGGGVSVHRSDCSNVCSLKNKPERLIEVSWASKHTAVFLVTIQVEALDRYRLLSDITSVLADEKVNILSANLSTSRDRVVMIKFSFELADPKHLKHVFKSVRNVEGVFDVSRVNSTKEESDDSEHV